MYLPNLEASAWPEGKVKQCWLASRTPPTPNYANDVLLCGDTAKQAWSLISIRDDVRRSLYNNSVQHQVNFHTVGHRGSRNGDAWWACKKTATSAECF